MDFRKYYYTINKKIPAGCLLLLFVFTGRIYSQNFKNPYSGYGIGELQEKTFLTNTFMGGVSLGWNDPYSFTPLNPASYSNMLTSTFDVALKGKIQMLEQGDQSFKSTIISFSYFSLGFPISKKIKWAAAFGLIPISSIGYKNTYSTAVNDSVSKTESFENSGGFSQIYLGTSIQLFKKINIGINISYLFGNTEDLHTLEFTGQTTNLNLMESNRNSYGNIYVEGGAQYIHKITDKKNLTIGAIFTPSQNIPANQKHIVQTFERISGTVIYKDSVELDEKNIGSITLPFKTGVGFVYNETGKWKIGLDYRYENWSGFQTIDGEKNLNDMHYIFAGGELIPDKGSFNYFKRIAYRAGIKYTDTYLKIDDKNMSVIGASLGFGFPITNKYNKSIINLLNFGVSGGKYLNVPEGGIKETFINVYFGVRFNDLWFVQPKIE